MSDCNCKCCIKQCLDRNNLYNSKCLRSKLGKLQQNSNDCVHPQFPNKEEIKYKNYSYNGSYIKGFGQNTTNGALINNDNYKTFCNSVINNNQKLLASVPMATLTTKQVDPLASLGTVLTGAPQCQLKIEQPPALSSKEAGAEMVELYCKLLARDVPFIDYETNPIIQEVLSYMNKPNVIANLPNRKHVPFTPSTIFRGTFLDEEIGPFMSQLSYLNIPFGATTLPQIYTFPPSKQKALANNAVVDWGRNSEEMIKIQNTELATLPPYPANLTYNGYVNTGRALAELVHFDPPYQLPYLGGLLLNALGIPPNPGFPQYPNQVGFVTGTGASSWQCAIAEVAGIALKHAWFWKWQAFRKLRPEQFSLWVNNIKNDIVPNKGNYDISDVLLNNPVLEAIKESNAEWGSEFENSYTLPTSYREGSPLHPAYPSGHAIIAGACVTILKIFFDCQNKKWISLPNLQNPRINPTPYKVVQANAQAQLVEYKGADIELLTVNGELNKLASGIAFGRDHAGIHYRSDINQGLLLGEQVAVKYMEDCLSAVVGNFLDGRPPEINFTGFEGNTITVKPTLCKRNK